jgi:hypothetical protein
MLEQNSDRHGYNTQQISDLQSKFCRTDIFKQSLNNMEIKIYNNLPSHLKILKNTQLFKKKLELFLMQLTFYCVVEYLSYDFV